jgi:hypothetical protein
MIHSRQIMKICANEQQCSAPDSEIGEVNGP